MDYTDRLQAIKRKNDANKAELNRLEGKLESLMLRMKNDFNCESIEELKLKIEEDIPKVKDMEKDIELRLSQMENFLNGR